VETRFGLRPSRLSKRHRKSGQLMNYETGQVKKPATKKLALLDKAAAKVNHLPAAE
jgi:hypothetical protein